MANEELGVESGRSRRIVVVTGASAGVGQAVVRAFAEQGADLALIARGRAGLDAARQEAEAAGSRVLVIPLDIADSEAVEAAAAQVESELGPIDVWVNNAMATVFAPVAQTTAEEYRRVTEVTYLGYGLERLLVPRDETQFGPSLS